ncbi:hypothetical protein [Paracoccus lutimaris]|uniref:Uncharacterized protein n=1 Tax=Paracoccus lutimaris TaxID=1490030 RepID=A0A368YPI0_9RHOB|nr:hypothetical protein [Paracoccus lutimaris]RCW82115.1 hypothetical protein DFP89_11375 [Paracoccus lutimaris]
MKTLSAAAATTLATALFAATLPASAGMGAETTIRLAAPLAGATLNSDQADMSVYYTQGKDKTLEVVATYVSDSAPQPLQMFMALSDGDKVQFGLPGHPETLYRFARNGNVVTVTSQATGLAVATPDPAGA